MARNNHRDELEVLYKKVRCLESENRSLRRELKQVKKFVDPYFEEQIEVEEEVVAATQKCPKCKAKVDVVQLGPKMLHHCKECNWRRTEAIKK